MLTAAQAETFVNAIQLTAFFVCFVAVAYRSVREHDRLWFLLVWFYCCNLLTLSYWMAMFALNGWTPQYGYVSNLGWVASYLFLFLFEATCDERRAPQPPVLVAWLPALACVPLCALYCTFGDIFYNLVYCAQMGATGYYAIRGIAQGGRPAQGATGEGPLTRAGGLEGSRALHAAVLGLVGALLATWTASCFCDYSKPLNAYVLCDFVSSLMQLVVLACALRAVRA